MTTCPLGHESADDEFCEVCGREIGGTVPPVDPAEAPDPVEAAAPEPTPEGATCGVCGAELAGRFCEECGHDSLATPPVAPAAVPEAADSEAADWEATVTADRAYYDSVMAIEGPDAAAITFPRYCPERHFPLRGKQLSIGRQSRSRGIHPDIDLIGPPEDPGISHVHAVLLAQPDGSWAIMDLDSANGTVLNDDPAPLTPNTRHPLTDGDRLYVGAWTRITIRRV